MRGNNDKNVLKWWKKFTLGFTIRMIKIFSRGWILAHTHFIYFFSWLLFFLVGSLGGCWSLSQLCAGEGSVHFRNQSLDPMRAFSSLVHWSRAQQQCFEGVLAASPASSTPSKLCPLELRALCFSNQSPTVCTDPMLYVCPKGLKYFNLSEVEAWLFSVVFNFLKYLLNVCVTGAGF